MTTRRLRAFKRWMDSNAIQCSDALLLIDDQSTGICVKSKCQLREGDLVATIPKCACLTIRTSGARRIIEAADMDGILGLAVAVMHERSLGDVSPWAGYLHLLPRSECLPLVWTLDEVDALLLGTELHKTVQEDKALMYEDWKECILPLIHSLNFKLDPNFFGVEDYFAAKSLVASRSFEIDDYHGFGMVPFADLFNHKTGAEDVHFTSTPSLDESDEDTGSACDNDYDNEEEERHSQTTAVQENGSSGTPIINNAYDGIDLEYSKNNQDNPMVLEMIMVKDVEAGVEQNASAIMCFYSCDIDANSMRIFSCVCAPVNRTWRAEILGDLLHKIRKFTRKVFNTYGCMGNAALLHRYGFTELDNSYGIVNIDLDLVLEWSTSAFSSRHTRVRLSLWRRLGYSGCVSQNSEYFEISFNGEPQIELLILLYIILLPDKAFSTLDLTTSVVSTSDFPKEGKILPCEISETRRDLLLTKCVCNALVSLADMREKLYGTSTLESDIERLKRCCCIEERKLYHSLVLRVSERKILRKLRTYCSQTRSRWSPRSKRKRQMEK